MSLRIRRLEAWTALFFTNSQQLNAIRPIAPGCRGSGAAPVSAVEVADTHPVAPGA